MEFKRYSEDEELDGAIRDFIKHRKALRKPMTERAVDLFLKKLRQISTDKAGQIEAINEAIERGWLSVYPPNVNYGSSRSQKTPNGFESSSSSSEDLRELEAMLINQSRKEG